VPMHTIHRLQGRVATGLMEPVAVHLLLSSGMLWHDLLSAVAPLDNDFQTLGMRQTGPCSCECHSHLQAQVLPARSVHMAPQLVPAADAVVTASLAHAYTPVNAVATGRPAPSSLRSYIVEVHSQPGGRLLPRRIAKMLDALHSDREPIAEHSVKRSTAG